MFANITTITMEGMDGFGETGTLGFIFYFLSKALWRQTHFENSKPFLLGVIPFLSFLWVATNKCYPLVYFIGR